MEIDCQMTLDPQLMEKSLNNCESPDTVSLLPSFKENSQLSVTIVWNDLSVYVPIRKRGLFEKEVRHRPIKRVLNNVIGIAQPGNLVAVMGSSGAGKSTLMNALSYNSPAEVSYDGDVLVNGNPIGSYIKNISGFVHQHDLFYEVLTISEHLHFMAKMKLDRRIMKSERTARIQELLKQLGLKKCEHTRIGRAGSSGGISGGERKRLSFATEILTDPPILFCDEPTTGLDSFSAQNLVAMMKDLASRGKTIICTIHQPSSRVFSMFDQLCLLADGRTAYMGPTSEAMKFLSNLGHVCPEHYNPADFYINTLAVFPGQEGESKKRIKTICDSFVTSESGKKLDNEIRNLTQSMEFDESTSTVHATISGSSVSYGCPPAFKTTTLEPFWLTKTCYLIWRGVIEAVRNPEVHIVRSIQKMILGLVVGLCFMGVGSENNQATIQGIQGVAFFLASENTYPAMYGVLHAFPVELPIFMRENRSGLYRVDSYYISKVISLLPGYIIEPALFTLIAYWLIGLRTTTDAFFITLIVAILTSNVAAACGTLFSVTFDDATAAFTCLIPIDYILLITGGVLINLGTLPIYISWAKFFSWFMYSIELFLIVQWNGVTNISCPEDPASTCITTGEEYLESRAFSSSNFTRDFIGFGILYAALHIAALISLSLKCRRK